MDVEGIETMLNMEGDVPAITIKEPSDPSTFIVLAVEQLNNWTWVGFSKNVGNAFCNVSSDVLFNKMYSNLAYVDVSHNMEFLHLNDSNKFENEIIKQLEKKFEPVAPTFETLNLGNGENPRLIKIGSTLNEKERKDLK